MDIDKDDVKWLIEMLLALYAIHSQKQEDKEKEPEKSQRSERK